MSTIKDHFYRVADSTSMTGSGCKALLLCMPHEGRLLELLHLLHLDVRDVHDRVMLATDRSAAAAAAAAACRTSCGPAASCPCPAAAACGPAASERTAAAASGSRETGAAAECGCRVRRRAGGREQRCVCPVAGLVSAEWQQCFAFAQWSGAGQLCTYSDGNYYPPNLLRR
jgi:hypothetical protein